MNPISSVYNAKHTINIRFVFNPHHVTASGDRVLNEYQTDDENH